MAHGGRRPSPRGHLRASVLAVGLAVLAGCSVLGPQRLDVPPGYSLMMGEIGMRGVATSDGLLEMVREDGAVRYDLPVHRETRPFAVSLPPGRYRMVRVRALDSLQVTPDRIDYPLGATVDVTAPAVYLGTVRLDQDGFAPGRLRMTVTDDFDRTVPALRARYLDIPATVERSLVRPDA